MIESVPVEEIAAAGGAPVKSKRVLTREEKDAKNERERNARAAKGAKPRGAGSTKTRAPRGRTTTSLRPEISAFLTTANMLVLMTPLGTRPAMAAMDPTIPKERVGDELDTAEIEALAGALDAQCKRSPRFRRYVEAMLTVGAGGQLVTVLSLIVARRAARHGVLPNGEAIDYTLGALLASGDVTALGEFAPGAAPDMSADPETGETPPDMTAPVPGPAGFDFEPK